MEKETPTYTTILHEKRLKLGLTLNEYCVADSIHKLSNNSRYQWCEMSRDNIGKFIGISGRSVITIIKKLAKKGLVEVNPNTGKTRTTDKWISEVVLGDNENISPAMKKLHSNGEETSHEGGEETSHYNNINNINNNTATEVAEELKKKKLDDSTPMNLEQFIIWCKKSPQKHVQIIGDYAEEKKIKFTTKGQWESFIHRNLRAARLLRPYTADQLSQAMKKIERSDYMNRSGLNSWTLETLLKFLDK